MSQGAHHLEFLLKICNGFFLYEEKGVKSVQRGRVGGIGKALAEAPGGVCQGAGGQLHCLEAGQVLAVLQGDAPALSAPEAVAAVVPGIAQNHHGLFPQGLGLPQGMGGGFAFISLPAMFAELPGGRFFGMAFFALLFLAALTSAISILESLVAFLTEEFHLSRARAAIGLSVPMALLSAGYSLSQSAGRGINLPWFDFKNGMQMLPMNAVMEKFTDNLMIPLGALCFCLFVGWVWGTKAAGQEIAGEHGLRRMQKPWAFAVRFLAPLVIVVILYFTLGMGEGLS